MVICCKPSCSCTEIELQGMTAAAVAEESGSDDFPSFVIDFPCLAIEFSQSPCVWPLRLLTKTETAAVITKLMPLG